MFYPAEDEQKAREWPGGVEDPRIVEREDGTYVLTYTQWNRTDVFGGNCDLARFEALDEAWAGISDGGAASTRTCKYKSAGIVTQLESGRLIAAKIEGRYWMYWGEGAIKLGDIGRTRFTGTGGGYERQSGGVAAAEAGSFRQHVSRDGTSAGADQRGNRDALQREECDETGGDPALGPSAYAAGEALFDGTILRTC